MKLASRRFCWYRPEGLPAAALRPWLLQRLRAEGEPLRWAITGVEQPSSSGDQCVQVEAVLLRATPSP